MSLHIGICTLNAMRTLPVVMDAIAQAKLHDKLWVVDSGSTDGTIDFATASGATVMHRDWDGMVGQRRFLLEHCRAQGANWALMLDADEWPDASLWSAVAKLLAQDPPNISGAVLHRQLMVHGKPLNHVCQPERRLRLVRPEHASVVGSCGNQAEGIHDRIEVEGATIQLTGKLMHDAFADLGDALSRNLGYARVEAASNRTNGGLGRLLFSPLAAFCKQFVLKQGFRDGRRGFLMSQTLAMVTWQKHLLAAERRLLDQEANKSSTKGSEGDQERGQ